MAKKYFGYGFQVKRTKWGLLALAIFITIIVIIFTNWYSDNRTTINQLGNMTYKTFFGVNEFESNECNKAYRINYKKNTCGTLCINKINKNNTYLEDLKKSMEENGFIFYNISSIKLGNENWNYLQTNGTDPIMNYYSVNTDKDTYTIEYIDQTNSVNKNVREKCNKIINDVTDSITLRN